MKIYCNSINNSYLNKVVFLKGWIYNLRSYGNFIFFDLIDRTGFVQTISKKKFFLNFLKIGFQVNLLGLVSLRNSKNFNFFINTGEIEIFLLNIFFLNFYIFSSYEKDIKNFILNNNLINNLKFKSFVINIFNFFFFFEKFFYIETPILNKFFSEGSKVYVIPYRLKNIFFSLSESPQIFKQLFMIYRFEKYYQIAKCFRDEGFRKDRNVEFIQLDFEVSFINNFDILFFIEKIFFYLIFKIFNYCNFFKFSIIFYNDCLKYFFTDKPDLRFKNRVYNFFFFYYLFFKKNYLYNFFNLFFLFGNNFKNFFFFLKNYNFIKFFFFIFNNFYYLNLFISINYLNIFLFEILSFFNFKNIFLIFLFFYYTDNNYFKNFFFSKFSFLNNLLNYSFLFLFIINFPLFNYNFIFKKYNFLCNPFSKVLSFDTIYLDLNPILCLSKSYDIILNGLEIGGGSVRNEKSFLQKKIFLISLNIFETSYNFKFFLNFLKKSPPEHCGAAIGIDRLIINFLGFNNIKNVSIFSKTDFSKNFLKTPNFIF